ncbi:amidohydrolase [Pedobacter quisquiliarum]|uniref:Amidohydrolase n=1 Tax=Pedobacter quisquiliarum TaxID=1834438 RepID=A0A916U7H6_9SPHI|nr:amidohydrolase family protein [Pedobacter quisquiliarum]GGC62352.1 amidohydrolase [Pedobacter quisquiliarum]
MLKIDAHQHFWLYSPVRDQWINNDMAILQGDFMPEHLQPILEHYDFQGTVVVQSDQSPAENLFQLENAEKHPFIKAVVGWVDMQAPDLEAQLQAYQQYPKLKGFRSMLQSDPDRSLMLRPHYQSGIAKLQTYGYTFDILVLPDQLKYAEALVAAFPEQRFVLNHLGKPNIRLRQFEDWVADIKALAVHENVYCKVSGMVTEADLTRWKFEDFKPYIDTIFECFGMERVMYGSDWPVCRLAATFGEVMEILENYTANFTNAERALFWAKNAIRFYNINMD